MLKSTTRETANHLWAIDPTAQVIAALSPNGIADLVIFSKKGQVAYRGSFPGDYTQFKSMVEEQLKAG